MKKLNSKEIKYLGEGIVGVYERGRLTERFQLEKGDNLLEGMKKLTEISSHGSGYDPIHSGEAGDYDIFVTTDFRWINSLKRERDFLLVRVYDNTKSKYVISAYIAFGSLADKKYAAGLADSLESAKNFNKMVDILESDPKVEELEVNGRLLKSMED